MGCVPEIVPCVQAYLTDDGEMTYLVTPGRSTFGARVHGVIKMQSSPAVETFRKRLSIIY